MRLTRPSALLLAASLLIAGAAAKPAKSVRPQPLLRLSPSPIEATPEFGWSFNAQVVNRFDVGLYTDSAFVHYDDRDPGETGLARTGTLPLPALLHSIESVSAGDSADAGLALPAEFEEGTLRVTLHGHTGDGTKFVAESGAIPVVAGPSSKEHPSELLTVNGRKVEWVHWAPAREGPAPALLVVHDHGSKARHQLPLAMQLAARGYAVGLVSLPGYGSSEGPADAAHTAAALAAALDRLKKTPGVDGARLGAWGFGRGASAVAELAATRDDLVAVVAQSGVYEPALAGKIRAATLVLHGEQDREAPFAQAKSFAAALPAGSRSESKFIAGGGHRLPRSEIQRSVLPFLTARLAR